MKLGTSTFCDFSWPTKFDDPGWNNVCMMMGFNLYSAWLRVSDWYPASGRDLQKCFYAQEKASKAVIEQVSVKYRIEVRLGLELESCRIRFHN